MGNALVFGSYARLERVNSYTSLVQILIKEFKDIIPGIMGNLRYTLPQKMENACHKTTVAL